MRRLGLVLAAAALAAGCGSSSSSGGATNAISSSLRHKIIAGYVRAGATPHEATQVADCVVGVLENEGYVTGPQIQAHSLALDTATLRCKRKLGVP